MSREIGKLEEMVHEKAGRYFRGYLVCANFGGRVRLMPEEKRKENSPDFSVQMPGHDGNPIHVGAAWWKRSGQGLHYLSISVSAPGVPTLNCAVFAENDQDFKKDVTDPEKGVPSRQGRDWRIVWNEPRARPAPTAPQALPLADSIGF